VRLKCVVKAKGELLCHAEAGSKLSTAGDVSGGGGGGGGKKNGCGAALFPIAKKKQIF